MRLSASGNRLTLTSPDRLVSGSINVFSCYFDFDSSWDGYFPTAVFESTLRAKKVEQAVINGECLFPYELLDAGARVRVGIYGVNGDKRRPTTYAEWMPVAKGTETGGAAEAPPSPNVYESILAAITDGRLVGPPGPTGADGPPGPDGYSPAVALTETESGVRVSVQNKDNVQSATVLNGKDGAQGKDGVGIQSVTQTTTSSEDGGTNIVTVTKTDGTTSTFEVRNGGGGTSDHSKLKNRDAADQHPMSAITGLVDELAGKQPTGNYLTKEQDPTVPEWAKQPQKPAYTAQEVGALPASTHIPSTAADVNAEPSGAVSQHNVSDAAHNDIRLLIQGLSDRLSAVADSDDTTLDQLSEVVAYIKSNRDLISAITTSKVNVADIVDNLTTNVSNKPLSAAQGVALKALIDEITVPDKLPNPNALTFTGAVTGIYDGSAPLSVEIPRGGGGSGWELVSDTTLSEDVSQLEFTGLDCYDLRVTIYGRWNDANDSLSNADLKANILLNEPGQGYQYSNSHLGYIRPSGGNFHTLIEATAANAMYPKMTVSLLPAIGPRALKDQSWTFETLTPGTSWIGGKTGKINKILIVSGTSGVMLKSGSRIIVMKRS